ncbi:RNA-directed DNA polymerase from mobile element jockey [Plakobranchus ocellatus]|uniref:RNA-directed DNA polymerase from mobile element jockey n=1 Tax=Plakobranchus ocellatus TaxID=259542 RepID=A0AAV4CTM1_9GAST|nr:RNA-directed DNA polymerase from mobile element jockey [Plakobranchus ocellatus]
MEKGISTLKRFEKVKRFFSLPNGRFRNDGFDQKLTFKNHVTHLKKKCLEALNLLRVLGHTDWGADRATLLKLNRTLVRSKLDYGSAVCGSAKKHVLRALDPIHHQGLLIALGAFRTSPINSLYAEAGEPSLEHRRIKLAFSYVLKLKSLPRNPCHDVVFEAPLSDFSADSKSEPNLVANTFEHIKNAKINLKTIDIFHVQCPPPCIQGNENVDKLAKAALNRASCSGKLICWSDLKPKINAYIHTVWQENWDAEGANKLHEVLPNMGEDLHKRGEGASRKRETAMCRLRRNNLFVMPVTAFTLSGIF